MIRRNEHETRAKLSIAFDPARRYLELACNQRLSVLHIRIVDADYQGLSGMGRLDGLAVRRVESLGLKSIATV